MVHYSTVSSTVIKKYSATSSVLFMSQISLFFVLCFCVHIAFCYYSCCQICFASYYFSPDSSFIDCFFFSCSDFDYTVVPSIVYLFVFEAYHLPLTMCVPYLYHSIYHHV